MTEGAASETATAGTVATVAWLNDVTVTCYGTSAAVQAAEATLRQFGATVWAGAEDGPAPRSADIVLVDRVESVPEIPGVAAGDAASYLDRVAEKNSSVWATISPFGIQGERGDAIGSELTVEASGGFLAHARFDEALPPTVTPGYLGLRMVGIAAAVAALHGLHTVRRTNEPVHVDVSAQAVLVATGLALEMG